MKTEELWNFLIQSGLLATLLGFVVSVIKCAKVYIDAKTAEATAKIKNYNIKNAINAAEDCITTVVEELAQTTADDLKAKSADGKLTAEDAAKIKADAIAKVEALLSDDVQKAVAQIFGDTEQWISSKVEAAVRQLKQTPQKAA